MISSLQTRLLLAVSVLAIAAVVAVAIAARQGTRIEFRRLLESEHWTSPSRNGRVAEAAAAALDGRCCEADDMARAAAGLDDALVLIVVDEAGTIVASGGPGASRLRSIRTRLQDGTLRLDATRVSGGASEQIALQLIGSQAPAIRRRDGATAAVYVVPLRSSTHEPADAAFLGSVDRRLVVVTSLVAALVLGLTWVLTRRVVRPIGELREAARDVARGEFGRRVHVRGSDEIAGLAHSFNAMATELERQQQIRRQLVHDVAHELRTPVTALRCRLETILDGLAADPRQSLAGASDEIGHLSRLVDDLQELTLAEARELRLTIAAVPLAEVARSAARAAGLEADPRLRIDLDPSLHARGDVVRMRQVLVNLLTNADRHTPPDGAIAVRGAHHGAEVVVEVHNTGSALDADQLARVFDRFYRADPSRQRATGGSGLGLSIVKHLVEAQGGRVGVTSGPSGVTFTLTIPGRA